MSLFTNLWDSAKSVLSALTGRKRARSEDSSEEIDDRQQTDAADRAKRQRIEKEEEPSHLPCEQKEGNEEGEIAQEVVAAPKVINKDSAQRDHMPAVVWTQTRAFGLHRSNPPRSVNSSCQVTGY